MAGLLPSSSEVEPPEGDPRVIGVEDADAETLLSALSAETARRLLAEIYEQPATPSTLAERTDTSLQNAQYHLEKLESADLIEVIDTRYSEKGREMNVYGAKNAPVVLFAGSEDQGQDVKSALTSLIGGIGVVGVGAILIQEWVGRGVGALAGGGETTDGAVVQTTTEGGGMVAQDAQPTATMTQTVVESAEVPMAVEQAAGLPPGLLFFLGGVLALLVVTAVWYLRG